MNTINQMAQKYRKLCKQVQRTDAKILKVKQQAHQLSQARNQIIQEMDHLRVLLDHCVVTGESPVQAQLSHSHAQMQVHVQEHRRQLRLDEYYFTSTGSSVTVGPTLPTSVTSTSTFNIFNSQIPTTTCTTPTLTIQSV